MQIIFMRLSLWTKISFRHLSGDGESTLSGVTNTVTPDSTPIMEFEKKATEIERQFRYPFGQPVICAKVGPKVSGMSVTRNEFGVVVGPGFL